MDNILIGVIGEDSDTIEVLFKGFSKFQPKRVVLLVKKKYLKKGDIVKKDLEKFGIAYEIKEVSNNLLLDETFIAIKEIHDIFKDDNVVINIDCDYMSSCLALSSAFVNGITAIGILNEEIIVYPIMKFSYYNTINEKKQELLKIIGDNVEVESMEKLSKLSKLSLPLIAYHLKGNKDSKGLLDMNLINIVRDSGSLKISLTDLGKLIVSGTIDVCNRKINKNV